jgi:hypothetical protein
MKKLLSISAALMLFAGMAFGQKPFEGQIDFWMYNNVDTTYYFYYVKGNHIKITNTDPKTNNDQGYFLIDLSTKKTTALSAPFRHTYFDQPSPAPVKPAGTPKVNKTGKTKTINGYKCEEIVVEDAEEGLKVSFWVATGGFDFFVPMMDILNRKDKFSEYYKAIPKTAGMFPMEATETDMSGAPKGSMKATLVKAGTVSDGTFAIPSGYNKVDRKDDGK